MDNADDTTKARTVLVLHAGDPCCDDDGCNDDACCDEPCC
jgi:hypothetical protein